MKPIYLGMFHNKKDVMERFKETNDTFNSIKILFAAYDLDGCHSDAFVLLKRGRRLFEVNGSHCSCYDLEGQWEPEDTTIRALRFRLKNGSFGRSFDEGSDIRFRENLIKVLASLSGKKA